MMMYRMQRIAHAKSRSCTTIVVSKLIHAKLLSNNWIGYYKTIYERDEINHFSQLKNASDAMTGLTPAVGKATIRKASRVVTPELIIIITSSN